MYARTGSLFEKHFKRIRIHDENYLRHLIVYTHLNPKHHLNIDFETYEFSSYSYYLSTKSTIIEKDYILEIFDDLENFVFVHKSRNGFLTTKFTFE